MGMTSIATLILKSQPGVAGFGEFLLRLTTGLRVFNSDDFIVVGFVLNFDDGE